MKTVFDCGETTESNGQSDSHVIELCQFFEGSRRHAPKNVKYGAREKCREVRQDLDSKDDACDAGRKLMTVAGSDGIPPVDHECHEWKTMSPYVQSLVVKFENADQTQSGREEHPISVWDEDLSEVLR